MYAILSAVNVPSPSIRYGTTPCFPYPTCTLVTVTESRALDKKVRAAIRARNVIAAFFIFIHSLIPDAAIPCSSDSCPIIKRTTGSTIMIMDAAHATPALSDVISGR